MLYNPWYYPPWNELCFLQWIITLDYKMTSWNMADNNNICETETEYVMGVPGLVSLRQAATKSIMATNVALQGTFFMPELWV